MVVVCVLLKEDFTKLPTLAEACLAFSPQIALSHEAVFVEVAGSLQLFSLEQCFIRLQEIVETFGLKATISSATDLPSALAFARYGISVRERLPLEALSDYLSPFAPSDFSPASLLRKLGLNTLGDFLQIPLREIPSRFGKDGSHAYAKIFDAKRIAWPRFVPPARIEEKAELDFAARIENLEPVFFILKGLIDRIFFRLFARAEMLTAFRLRFRLNRLAGARERLVEVVLPLPQSDPKGVLLFLQDRIANELQKRPLEDLLESVTLEVTDTAPFRNAQKDFFSKVEEEKEAWASLVARLRERLGENSTFLAAPAPRLLPEAAWKKSLEPGKAELLPHVPLRPLRILRTPLPLRREGNYLRCQSRSWGIQAFEGPERVRGEWWLGGFAREYFCVETMGGEKLWVFREINETALFLHGIFD
ncbi:MAG: hypothetical protein ACXWQJ_18775 [Bdellovibrionota bacterium]